MKLSYAELLSPYPLRLNIGSVIKPTLKRIAQLSFERFNEYEVLLKFKNILNQSDDDDEEEKKLSASDTFEMIKESKEYQGAYVEMLNFFFEERVVFYDGFFILLKKQYKNKEIKNIEEEYRVDDIQGAITEKNFEELISVISQVCGMSADEEEKPKKFKNKLAKNLYEKMKKAAARERKLKNIDKNFYIPNLISAVATRHPSLNLTNIWELTIYQLIDTFQRLQMNDAYDLSARSISIWGDKKNKFDNSLWFKNTFD